MGLVWRIVGVHAHHVAAMEPGWVSSPVMQITKVMNMKQTGDFASWFFVMIEWRREDGDFI